MIQIHPLPNLPEFQVHDNIAAMLAPALLTLGADDGDVLVVTQKIISKVEGRRVFLGDIELGAKAHELARKTGKDPRIAELILTESTNIVRAVPGLVISRHKSGHVMANAGIDASNIGPGGEGSVLLLPEDADASAATLRQALIDQCGLTLGVIISDSFGRPWRMGVVNVAIGVAGLPAIADWRGRRDRDGRLLEATEIAYADQIASAAGLAMGECAEGIPAVLVQGMTLEGPDCTAASLLRTADKDLFQ